MNNSTGWRDSEGSRRDLTASTSAVPRLCWDTAVNITSILIFYNPRRDDMFYLSSFGIYLKAPSLRIVLLSVAIVIS